MSEYCKYCGRSYPDARTLLNNSCPLHPDVPWHALFYGERRNDHHTTLAEKSAAMAAEKETGK